MKQRELRAAQRAIDDRISKLGLGPPSGEKSVTPSPQNAVEQFVKQLLEEQRVPSEFKRMLNQRTTMNTKVRSANEMTQDAQSTMEQIDIRLKSLGLRGILPSNPCPAALNEEGHRQWQITANQVDKWLKLLKNSVE